jgi:hypothetical protein
VCSAHLNMILHNACTEIRTKHDRKLTMNANDLSTRSLGGCFELHISDTPSNIVRHVLCFTNVLLPHCSMWGYLIVCRMFSLVVVLSVRLGNHDIGKNALGESSWLRSRTYKLVDDCDNQRDA